MEGNSYPMQVTRGDKETVGSYQLKYYTPQDAFKKGLKMFFVTLFVAIFSIVLPGVHFVSVPLGILASPLVGIYFYKVTRKGKPKGMAGDFVCPECQAKNHVASSRLLASYESQCAHCGVDVRLTPLAGPHVSGTSEPRVQHPGNGRPGSGV